MASHDYHNFYILRESSLYIVEKIRKFKTKIWKL